LAETGLAVAIHIGIVNLEVGAAESDEGEVALDEILDALVVPSGADENQAVDAAARYLPAGTSRKALYVLPVAVVAAFAAMALGAWWRRRRARREGA